MRSASFLVLSFSSALFLAAACSSAEARLDDDDESDDAGSSSGKPQSSSSGGKGSSSGGSSGSSSGQAAKDAGEDAEAPGEVVCENELALYLECGFEDTITCRADGYVANCRDNNDATESAQRIAGRNACLGPANCDPDDRKECIYETYNSSALDPEQTSLLEHYCQTCEAANVEACKARTLTYTTVAATDTIFLAAWELAPSLVNAIDAQCIDAAKNGDAGTCAERFDDCAGGIYVDALVVCAD